MSPPKTDQHISNPTCLWTRQDDSTNLTEWSGGLRVGALVGVMNFSGEAQLIWRHDHQLFIRAGDLVWIQIGKKQPAVSQRLAGSQHECLSLIYPNEWLSSTLHHMQEHIIEPYAPLLRPPWALSFYTRPLTAMDRAWAISSMAQHLCLPARMLFETSRLTEFLLREIFPTQPPTLPMNRTERIARERVAQVKQIILKQLDDPPKLEELAKIVGCSPHYLSRTFTAIEKKPLILWLRAARMDRAAALIAAGECNVSEAAIEVGYLSFSHFSRAFRAEKGVSPSQWARSNTESSQE